MVMAWRLKTNKHNVIIMWCWCWSVGVVVYCIIQRYFVCLLILREMLLNNINYTPHYSLRTVCFTLMKMELINQTFTLKHVLIILAFKQSDSSHCEAEFQISWAGERCTSRQWTWGSMTTTPAPSLGAPVSLRQALRGRGGRAGPDSWTDRAPGRSWSTTLAFPGGDQSETDIHSF